MTTFHSELNFARPQGFHPRRLMPFALTAVLSVVVGGALVWNTATRNTTATISNATISATPSPTSSPGISRALPKTISEHAVSSVAHGLAQDTVRYYEQETGRAFLIDLRTLKTETLSDRKLPGFIQSYWVPNANRVISLFSESRGSQYRYYDYQTKETRTIGSSISTLAISPNGRRIAFIDTAGEDQALYIADTNGTSVRKVLGTRAQQVALTWPREDALVLTSKRPDRAGSDMAIIGLSGELRVLMSNRENLEYAWSPDGSRLLFSYFYPGRGITLWYRTLDRDLDIAVPLSTSARKCAWHTSLEKITCGIPTTTTLSRDTPSDRTATIDDIATFDLQAGTLTTHYQGTTTNLLGVIDPSLSSSERYFLFTNIFDRRLSMVELP